MQLQRPSRGDRHVAVAAVSARGYNCMQMAGFFLTPRARAWLFAIILVSATIFAYKPAWNGDFIWDDDLYITKNHLLVAPDGLKRIWFSLDSPSQYFPLTYTTFRIEHALWGPNPTGYHWINILLHAANALVLWWLLKQLKIPGAWLAAGIFALHPVQVESVAWITERKNVLMGFFFLLTLVIWTKFLDAPAKERWRFYLLALMTYLLALAAKSTACTLPVALLLILWLQGKRIDRSGVLAVVPFFVLGLAMGLVAIWWERYHQGTRADVSPLAPLERILVASHAIWFYLGKLFWPTNLTFIYPRWNIAVGNPLAYIWLLAGIVAGAGIYFARRFVGRSVEVAAVFFGATLSPVIGFIMLYTFRYTFVADHYQYLACIGPIALVSAGLVKLAELVRVGAFAAATVGVLIMASLGPLTWNQSAMYRDIETLWRTTLERNPACWMAENNLGIALVEKGQVDEAIRHYEQSLRIDPNVPETHYNYGNALLRIGRTADAIDATQKALALQGNDPDALVALGNALFTEGGIDSAIDNYLKALALNPDHSSAHYNLANALLHKGDVRKAITHYSKSIELQPNFIEALTNLAWVFATSPDFTLRNGYKAINLAEKANRLTPENPFSLRTLAAAYAEGGRFDQATATARQALEMAEAQHQDLLAERLRHEISLYEKGSSFRDP